VQRLTDDINSQLAHFVDELLPQQAARFAQSDDTPISNGNGAVAMDTDSLAAPASSAQPRSGAVIDTVGVAAGPLVNGGAGAKRQRGIEDAATETPIKKILSAVPIAQAVCSLLAQVPFLSVPLAYSNTTKPGSRVAGSLQIGTQNGSSVDHLSPTELERLRAKRHLAHQVGYISCFATSVTYDRTPISVSYA